MRATSALLLLLALSAVGEEAAPTTPARLVFRFTDPQDRALAVTGRVVATFPGQDVPARELRLEAASAGTLEVPAGSSLDLVLEAPGFWAFGQGVNLRPEERERAMPLRVWRTGRVTGTVRGVAPTKEDPSPLSAQILPPIGAPFTGQKPAGRVPCRLEPSGAFQCELPAESLDLAFRAVARVPAYRFGVKVAAGAELKLGTLELPLGGSIAGFVVSKGDPLDPKTCRIRATRAVGSNFRGLEQQLVETAETARPSEKGFFQLKGLAPGRYQVTVEQPGLGPAILGPLEVPPSDELILREPIALWPPVAWHVRVTPPLDGQGRPWKLEVSEARPRVPGLTPRNPEHFPFDETGFLQLEGLEPGPYRFSVEDADGNRLSANFEPRELAPEPAIQEIEIPLELVEIDGRLLRGDEPLAGQVWFGGRFGVPNARFEADDAGRFRGFLSGEQRHWHAEVTRPDGRILAEPYVLVEPNDEGRAEVEIRIPDTRLTGRVVDERGRGLEGVRIVVATSGSVKPPRDPRSGPEGRFAIEGLEPGTVLLSARADRGGEERLSEVVAVELREEQEPSPVKLVVRPLTAVRGRVLLDGAPVAAAQVLAWPLAGPPLNSREVSTDLNGAFALTLPQGTQRAAVRVAALGVPFQAVHLDTQAQPWSLGFSSSAGELVLRWPRDDQGEPLRGRVLTFWNGVDLGPETVFLHRQAQGMTPFGQPDERELTIPLVAPGHWSVCMTTPAELMIYQVGAPGPWLNRCASGTLGVGQTLRLDLKAP